MLRIPAPTPYRLQILHGANFESAFFNANTLGETILGYSAALNGLRHLAAREGVPSLHLITGDITLPGPLYEASREISELGSGGLADIAFMNAMEVAANGMGHHEFDRGLGDFSRMVRHADFPFLAANLDFSALQAPDEAQAVPVGTDGAGVRENAGNTARSSWVEAGGERIGLIGRVPDLFFHLVNEAETKYPGLDFVGGRDPESNLPVEPSINAVLEQVELLEVQGIDKIVLLDNTQDFIADALPTEQLRGIDIIVSAGDAHLMAGSPADGPFNTLREGHVANYPYPIVRQDSEGHDVLLINSERRYDYVGQLLATFAAAGHIVAHDHRSGLVSTEFAIVEALEQRLAGRVAVPELQAAPEIDELLERLLQTDIVVDQLWQVGETIGELVGNREALRTRETNLGRLVADSTLWHGRLYLADLNSDWSLDLALKNSGGIRQTVEGPVVTRLKINSVLLFDNTQSIALVTGRELLATLENAVSYWPSVADGRYPQSAGFYLEFDASRPPVAAPLSLDEPSRIKNLVIFRADGTSDVLVEEFRAQGDLNRTFGVIVNSFMMAGGDGYLVLKTVKDDPEREVHVTEWTERQILETYIVEVYDRTLDLPDPLPDPRIVPY